MAVQASRRLVIGAGTPSPEVQVRLAVLVALVALNGVLALEAGHGGNEALDLPLLRTTQQLDFPLLAQILRPVDVLTSAAGAVVAWLVLLGVFVTARWWLPATAMLALPVGGIIDNAIDLVVTPRARPSADEVVRVATGADLSSYPSGHVLGAVLLYGLLFVVAERLSPAPLRRGVRVLCCWVLLTVGIGRLWYGAHWPTDVLGGYALGALLLLPLVWGYRAVERAEWPLVASPRRPANRLVRERRPE
jgi:undecaprenyl-diphosphatase